MTTPGRLEVIAGPMFSGKSAELISRVVKAQHAQETVLIVRPSIDTRAADPVVISRDGRSIPAIVVDVSAVERHVSNYVRGVVAFDEAQFFDHSLVLVIKSLLERGTRVIVAGLDLDYASEPFGPMPTLLALADTVDKLTAVCNRCHCLYATRTQRMVDGRPAVRGERVVIDKLDKYVSQGLGNVTYEARCIACYCPPSEGDFVEQLTQRILGN